MQLKLKTASVLFACSIFLINCDQASKTSIEDVSSSVNTDSYCLNLPVNPVLIHGADTTLGSEKRFYPEELKIRDVTFSDFKIDAHEVTNRQFKAFVDATGYVTMAETYPDADKHEGIDVSLLVPGSAVFVGMGQSMDGWKFVEGARWNAPEGPGSSIEDRLDYPVVHVTFADALAYAEWAGGDLPTEDEWEYVARNGKISATYEWGEIHPDKTIRPKANTWQGFFPFENNSHDGYEGAAPVGCFEPNSYGVYDLTGNVWELVKGNPIYPDTAVMKGGSFLCADNYCKRYRPGSRQPQELDFSTNHVGFRLVYRE